MRNSHIPAESPFENKKEIGIWIIPNEFKILATYVTSSIPFSLGFFSLFKLEKNCPNEEKKYQR